MQKEEITEGKEETPSLLETGYHINVRLSEVEWRILCEAKRVYGKTTSDVIRSLIRIGRITGDDYVDKRRKKWRRGQRYRAPDDNL